MATLLSIDHGPRDTLHSVTAIPAAAPGVGTLIVVVGMHRSGTSVIARAMATVGAELGNRLGAPKAGENDKGFFEDLDIVEINEQIITAANAKWHTLAPVDFNRIDPIKLAALRAKAVSVLREKCRDRTFALKDPRLSRLLSFWQPVFDEIGLRVAYVVAVRNPINVGFSLKKRNGFPLEKSYSLWLSHMVAALQLTLGKPRVVVEYDRLLDSPRAELTRIAGRLGLGLNDEHVQTFEREFLDRGLQHWRFESQNLADVHAMPREARELFAALVAISRADGQNSQAELDRAVFNAQRYLGALVRAQPKERSGGGLAAILQQIARAFRVSRR